MNLFTPILQSRPFWVAFFHSSINTYECPSLREPEGKVLRSYENFTLSFEFPERYSLCWNFDGGENPLLLFYFKEPEYVLKQERLGWKDCHSMSDVFRWEEFQSIITYLAATDHDRPSWMLILLFSPYVAVTPDCADAFFTMLCQNLQASGMFTEEEVRFITNNARSGWIRPNLRWVEDAKLGWLGEDEYVWSMRQRLMENKFDFALLKDFFCTLEKER
jgi:hypothetical protein